MNNIALIAQIIDGQYKLSDDTVQGARWDSTPLPISRRRSENLQLKCLSPGRGVFNLTCDGKSDLEAVEYASGQGEGKSHHAFARGNRFHGFAPVVIPTRSGF